MKKEFFQKTRKNYVDLLDDYSLTILFSGSLVQSTSDQDYPFEVNRNFYYLTGINQQDVILAIVKSGKVVKEILFIEKHDELMSKWVGDNLTKDQAIAISGIEEVKFLEDFEKE